MSSTKLYDRAERFIIQAMETITEFPIKRETLEKAVTALVNDHWFEGSELSLADDFVWDFSVPVDDNTYMTPLYVLNCALRRAVLEAADFDSYVQESHQQWVQWESILSAADTLGIQAHWQHTDYELLDGIYYKLDATLGDLEDMLAAWDTDGVIAAFDCKQSVIEVIPTSIGLPASEDYNEWSTFTEHLSVLWDRISGYLQNFAWNSPAFARRDAWERVKMSHQKVLEDMLPEHEVPTLSLALANYSRDLKRLASAIDSFLKLV